MSKRKLTRRAALACLGSGAIAMGIGSSAFTSVNAGREVSVDITDDDGNALLGISDRSESASVDGPNDSAILFDLIDNISGLTEDSISVEVLRLVADGNTVDSPPVSATVENSGEGQFEVRLSCDSENDLDSNYNVVLQFVAATNDVSVTAERATAASVLISCTYDYGNESSYRDEDSDNNLQPTNANGTIDNASGVSQKDDDEAATVESPGGGESAKVGWLLPKLPSSNSYELELAVLRKGPTLTGSWVTYLVDSSGTRLTPKISVRKGEKVYNFTGDEATEIANNRDELYLIFETTDNGNGNKAEIDFFELRAA